MGFFHWNNYRPIHDANNVDIHIHYGVGEELESSILKVPREGTE